MNILFLGPFNETQLKIKNFIIENGDNVLQTANKISTKEIEESNCEFLISYGYRYIIKNEVLKIFGRKAINLHISYLPWNRGADPNLWSFLESTPKGVTIHRLDEGVDTGPILSQKEVQHCADDTLRTSYNRLIQNMETLFKETWQKIRAGQITEIRQEGAGSFHTSKDKEKFLYLLVDGWDTKVTHIEGRALIKK